MLSVRNDPYGSVLMIVAAWAAWNRLIRRSDKRCNILFRVLSELGLWGRRIHLKPNKQFQSEIQSPDLWIHTSMKHYIAFQSAKRACAIRYSSMLQICLEIQPARTIAALMKGSNSSRKTISTTFMPTFRLAISTYSFCTYLRTLFFSVFKLTMN